MGPKGTQTPLFDFCEKRVGIFHEAKHMLIAEANVVVAVATF